MAKIIKDVSALADKTSAGSPATELSNTASKFGECKSDVADTKLEKKELPKAAFNTSKVAEINSKDITGGGSFNNSGSRVAASYSGTSGSIISDSSATTQLNHADRSKSRDGKKLDSTAKKINYIISEQVDVNYSEAKPLAESDELQGYNGTYRNAHARTQKINGGVPGELSFDRSIDEIARDYIYPIGGQYVTTEDTDKSASKRNPDGGDPITVWRSPLQEAPTIYNTDNGYAAVQYEVGNYVPESIVLKYKSTGELDTMTINTVDIATKGVDAVVLDMANSNAYEQANLVELQRQAMDKAAGDENQPGWSPLPRAAEEPTQLLHYMKYAEAETGTTLGLTMRKLQMGLSYQVNKATKDGQRKMGPVEEMMLIPTTDNGGLFGSTDETYNIADTFFNRTAYKAGSPALFIAMYDSPRKYNNKADFLCQPRSFKMALDIAKRNMKGFKLDSKTFKAIKDNEVFSTIDRAYDPYLPVYISDRAALAYRYNPSQVLAREYNYSYKDVRNVYTNYAAHPLWKGLKNYFNNNGGKIVSLCGYGTDNTITIPVTYSTTQITLWELVVCMAIDEIKKARIDAFTDIDDYTAEHGYPFSDLEELEAAGVFDSPNYTNNDPQEAINVGVMREDAAIRWQFSEDFWIVDEDTDEFKVRLPWYFNETQFEDSGDYITLKEDGATMSWPTLRSGTHQAALDKLQAIGERGVRLALDKMVVFPGYKDANVLEDPDWMAVYKYGSNTDGQPVISYKDGTTVKNIHLIKTPREFGYIIPAPNGCLYPADANTAASFANGAAFENGAVGWRIKLYYNAGAVTDVPQSAILNADTIKVNRAASLYQYFKQYTNKRGVTFDYGFSPSISALFNCTSDGTVIAKAGASLLAPFMVGSTAQTSNAYKVVSLQKALWYIIQRNELTINPFECIHGINGALKEDGIKVDPYDTLYWFGLAGFRASDYNQDIYVKLKDRNEKGMEFVENTIESDSPIFK